MNDVANLFLDADCRMKWLILTRGEEKEEMLDKSNNVWGLRLRDSTEMITFWIGCMPLTWSLFVYAGCLWSRLCAHARLAKQQESAIWKRPTRRERVRVREEDAGRQTKTDNEREQRETEYKNEPSSRKFLVVFFFFSSFSRYICFIGFIRASLNTREKIDHNVLLREARSWTVHGSSAYICSRVSSFFFF